MNNQQQREMRKELVGTVNDLIGDVLVISVYRGSKTTLVTCENVAKFIAEVRDGQWDADMVMQGEDELGGTEIHLVSKYSFLNESNNKRGDVNMNNNNNVEVIVNNNERGAVNMEKVFVNTELLNVIKGEMNKLNPALNVRFSFKGTEDAIGNLVVTGKFNTAVCWFGYSYVQGFAGLRSFNIVMDGVSQEMPLEGKLLAEKLVDLINERTTRKAAEKEAIAKAAAEKLAKENETKVRKDVNEMKNTRVKMATEFKMFANSTQERGIAPQIAVSVEGLASPATRVTFSNFNSIVASLESGKYSALNKDAKDDMNAKCSINKDVFVIELTSDKVEAAPVSIKMPLSGLTKEDKEAKQEELAKAMEAHQAIEALISSDVEAELYEELGLEATNLKVSNVVEPKLPNAQILEQSTRASRERYEELLAVAPTTGITTAAQFMDELARKVIADNIGFSNKSKIETKHMNFFNVKLFQKDGTGRDYKRVAAPWLFNLLDINNFVILSNVPNKNTLRDIMKNGFIANVKVGEEIIGYNEDETPIKEDIMEEKLFKYVASSASKQRQERYIFTSYSDREVIRKMLVMWSDQFNFGKESAIAKSESRVGQNLSTGVCIGGAVPYAKRAEFARSKYAKHAEFYYIVVEDMTVAEFKMLRGETTEPGDDKKVLGDGSGFHTEAAGRKAKRKLRNRHAMILQHRLGKGTTYEVSNEFVLEFCKNRGLDVNPELPVVFVSESMWKFNPGIELLPFIVLRGSEEMSDYAAMCYETWNALDISSANGFKTLETLAKRQFNMFNMDSNTDAGLIMHRLGTISKMKAPLAVEDMDKADDKEKDLMEDESLATSLFRFFTANPFYARRSAYLMLQVRMLFARKIADMARGKILVDGSFCIMMTDPGMWTGKTVLKAGQVYVGGRTGKCLLARYPMVYMGEPQVMEAVDCPEFAKYKGLNIVIMNAFDFAWERMQGADFDGDACLVTFEKLVIDLAVSHKVPEAPEMEKKSATEAVMGWDSISAYYIKNFEIMHPEDTTYVPTIGKTNNIVAALLSSAHTNGTFLTETTIARVQHLAVTINDLIDAAKTGVMPELEKFYFDTYKLLPNWLAKGFKTGRSSWKNTWEVETIEQDPESIYYLDTKSPLGKLANVVVPELYNKFIVAGDNPFKVDDFVGMYDSSVSATIQTQIDGIRKEYVSKSSFIFGEDNKNLDEKAKTDEYRALCDHTNGRIKKVAAAFNNDIYTVAIACLISGGSRGFAFKCFEEGVIAVFEKMEGVTLYKANGAEVPAGSVTVKYENVEYVAVKRASKEVQFNKLVAADLTGELTLRLIGLQYHGIQSMDDLKAKIAAANNIIVGGKATNGYYVAMANGQSIGKVTLDAAFAASTAFVQGGTAEVVAVNFVRSKSEQTMSYPEFMASKKTDAQISSADLTIRYTHPVKGGEQSPSAADESTMGLAETMMDYSVDASFSGMEELSAMDCSLSYMDGLASLIDAEVLAEQKTIAMVQSDDLPDANFLSLINEYNLYN